MGHNKHNTEFLKQNSEELIVVHRPSEDTNSDNYAPCGDWWGWCLIHNMWRHKCPLKSKKEREGDARKSTKRKGVRLEKRVSKKSRLQRPTQAGITDDAAYVLNSMMRDTFTRVVKRVNRICKKRVARTNNKEEKFASLRNKLCKNQQQRREVCFSKKQT